MITGKSNYLTETLGLSVKEELLSGEEKRILPLFIKKLELSRLTIEGRKVVAVKLDSLQNYTPKLLDKYKEVIESAFNAPALFCVDDLKPFERKRLIERKISFYQIGRQIYLPSLIMNFNEYRSRKAKVVKKLSPATQLILLFHLQKKSLDGETLTGVQKIIAEGYSLMTIGRSIEALKSLEFCEIESRRTKTIRFLIDGKKLWEAALPYLEKPVTEVLYSSELPAAVNKIFSGDTALAHYTNINESGLKSIALQRKQFRKLIQNTPLYQSEFGGELRIESWKYDPSLLCRDDKWVDPLSLYLCFRDDNDERVQLALTKLIEAVW